MCDSTNLGKDSLLKLTSYLQTQQKVSAILVVKSKKSGKDYTYKIKGYTSPTHGYSVFASYEKAYMDFQGCVIGSNGKANLFKRFANTDSEVILGARFVLDKLLKGNIDNILSVSEVHHTGNCIKCNRELTDLESIKAGIGPVCRNL